MFENIGIKVNGIISLTAEEAFRISENSIFVDIREEYISSYKTFNVPFLLNLPLSKIEEWKNNLPHDKQIIICDTCGIYCREVAQKLISMGYENIAVLGGGIVEWEKNNFPIIKDISRQLDGGCPCQLRYRHKGTS
ncbi:MAG: rhodanese-like domain-containing protein [Bacteroidales bacterium]|nr:rhodanese-like domain-containing protein [Bacteroidales bacterium]